MILRIFLVTMLVAIDASKILIVAPFYGMSHSTIIHKIGLHLASKGHDMTVITYNTIADSPQNYKQIKIGRLPLFDTSK
jgi:Na+/H+ antiporter NhaA